MKVVYLVHKFLPAYFSGTEIHTYNLASTMKKRGHEVQVICVESVDWGNSCHISTTNDCYEGIPVHRIYFNRKKTPDIVRYSYENPIIEEHIYQYIRTVKPAIAHITNLIFLSAGVIPALKKCKIPIVFTATDFWFFCLKASLLKYNFSICKGAEPKECLACIIELSRFYEIFLKPLGFSSGILANFLIWGADNLPPLKHFSLFKAPQAIEQRETCLREKINLIDRILVPTPFLGDLFLRAGTDINKIKISPYGINTAWFDNNTDKSPSENIRIGFIGMLARQKGVHLLIEAFNSIPRGSILKIYGDPTHFPDYAADLKKIAGNNPKILFCGTFNPREIGNIFKEIDVLVVPSLWHENTPLIIYSAFASQTPVVVSNLEGVTPLVSHESNGILFERGNMQELAGCLKELINNPRLLSGLREGIPPVRSIEDNVDELEKIYLTLLN